MSRSDDNNYNKKLNIIKKPLLINSLRNKEIIPSRILSIPKAKTPKDIIEKIDSKSQTTSNFLNYKIYSRNNYNYCDNINNLKEYSTNDLDNNKHNYFLLIIYN